MTNEFSRKLKELREKKFPGQSLRRVGEFLASLGDFGDYFFTQLHKMESGILFPSPNLVLRLMDAYRASNQERKDIFTAYSLSAAHKTLQEVVDVSNESIMKEATHQLYRKIRKIK